MGLTSLQVCMDTSDWLQGTVHEEAGDMDHSSSPPGEMSITCTRPPLLERRLRPQHDQALKCPRCDSTHTKFCYYNNYSLSQPRYFCKTCRRYWTKGGSLRNVPVGGGCRKNKKVAASSSAASKKPPNEQFPPSHQLAGSSSSSPTDLHLSFSHQLHTLLGNPNPMDVHQCKYDQHGEHLLGNHNYSRQAADLYSSGTTHDIHLNKFDALFGNYPGRSGYANFMGGGNAGGSLVLGDNMSSINNGFSSGTTTTSSSTLQYGFCSPLGFSLDNGSVHGTSAFMDHSGSERLMMPFGGAEEEPMTPIDMKPNPKQLLSLEWHEAVQAPHCSEVGKDHSYGFLMNAPGSSWSGMMNGYGSSSTTNPLV